MYINTSLLEGVARLKVWHISYMYGVCSVHSSECGVRAVRPPPYDTLILPILLSWADVLLATQQVQVERCDDYGLSPTLKIGYASSTGTCAQPAGDACVEASSEGATHKGRASVDGVE